MLGTMMDFPLTLQHIFNRGTRLFPDREIVTGGLGAQHRYTYKDFARRVHRLASAFKKLGLQPGDRVRLRLLPRMRVGFRRSGDTGAHAR